MIDLKNPEVGTYLNFIFNAILGADPSGADRYFKDNQTAIKNVAKFLYENFEDEHKKGIVYRGIVLSEQKKWLKPLKHIQYLSFSTDLEIARDFGNPAGSMALPWVDLGSHGYVIKQELDELDYVLFHWRYIDFLWGYLSQGFRQVGLDPDESLQSIINQKEVMIPQQLHKNYRLIPYDEAE